MSGRGGHDFSHTFRNNRRLESNSLRDHGFSRLSLRSGRLARVLRITGVDPPTTVRGLTVRGSTALPTTAVGESRCQSPIGSSPRAEPARGSGRGLAAPRRRAEVFITLSDRRARISVHTHTHTSKRQSDDAKNSTDGEEKERCLSLFDPTPDESFPRGQRSLRIDGGDRKQRFQRENRFLL